MALDVALQACALPGIVETVPSYRALMVHLDPLVADLALVERTLRELAAIPAGGATQGRLWRVPAVFGGDFGIDLETVAERADLAPAALVEAFVAEEYTVAMVGFLPGFCYLSGLPQALATPRRADPRPRIPASSVSVGGAQAALGSIAGPSGWHLLGRSPVRPFLPGREPVFLFNPGDRLRFDPIAADDWESLDSAATAGAWIAERL
jgi:KipI family sensor histidine kinase inhibitor